MGVVNAAFLSLFKRFCGFQREGHEVTVRKSWSVFCFTLVCCSYALTVGYVPLHGCFLTIKGLTWQDDVTAYVQAQWWALLTGCTEGKGRKRSVCHHLWVEDLSIFPTAPEQSGVCLLDRLDFSLMFSCSFSSLAFSLLLFPGFMFNVSNCHRLVWTITAKIC